jgi:hypothetical protein
MTSVSKSDNSSYLHKLSILKPLIPVLLIIISSFLLISCEGGVYSENEQETLYTLRYDSILNTYSGWTHSFFDTVDFSKVDNIIVSYDFKSTSKCCTYISYYSNYYPDIIFLDTYLSEGGTDFHSISDTIVIHDKYIGHKLQIDCDFNANPDSSNYAIIKNFKIIKY